MVAAYNIRHGAWLRAYYEGVLSCDVIHTGDVIPPFFIEYTPPTSPVRSNAFGSPQYSTNSLGCPVYFAFTSSQASLVSQVDLGSQRRSLSPPVAGAADAGSFFEWIRC
ncbi:hypothetical protein HN51_021876 [Arachis hypogaea]